MKWLVRAPIFLLFGLIPGCYVANLLEMDGLQPAEVAVSPAINSLAVISRSDMDSILKVSFQEAGRIKDFDRDSLLSKQIILGCSDALYESPRFELFNPVIRRTLDSEYLGASRKMPWEKILPAAGDPPTDALLSLEIVVVNDSFISGASLNPDQYTMYISTFWRLYRLVDFQTDEFSFKDTIRYYIDAPPGFTSSPDLKLEYIKSAMYEAGGNSARRLAPWWTGFERYYFQMGPRNFQTGCVYLRNGQWQEAAETWRPLTESRQKRTAAKACYNMALSCEMANSIPAALEWINQAEKMGMDEFYIVDYRDKLLKRKAETDKLNVQMK